MLNYTDITQNTYIQSWTVCTARSRIRDWCFRRGGVGGKAPTLQEKVKMEVEGWIKIVGLVRRGGES